MNTYGHPMMRMCNTANCDGEMFPTRRTAAHCSDYRIYRCPICGKENPWLDKPKLNGTFGELHCIETNMYSGLSMMSDPFIYPPKGQKPRQWHRAKRKWVYLDDK